MAFTINKNLVFIDSMQFMNSSLDALIKNLSDNDFTYLSEEFSDDLLKLVKQKGVYPYEYMNRFKKFSEDKLPDRCKISSPGLCWDAMLKMTGIELELISDIGMHLFIERGMRGGISYIAKRHSKANNKYMKCYDSSKESKYVMYLDANMDFV